MAVANISGEFEYLPISHFSSLTLSMFANKLKEYLHASHYDVLLNEMIIQGWSTFKDCIDYIYDEHFEQ